MKRFFIIFAIVFSIITITTKVYSDIPAPPPRPDFDYENRKFVQKQTAVNCLTMAIYYEARNDTITGQKAVAAVIINRVLSKKYPNSICEVVTQAQKTLGGQIIRNGCQFSFYCDGVEEVMANEKAAEIAFAIAEYTLYTRNHQSVDKTEGALHYYAANVSKAPYWSIDMICFLIGKHLFCV